MLDSDFSSGFYVVFSLKQQPTCIMSEALLGRSEGPRSDALLGRSEGKASETSHTSGTIRRKKCLTMKDFDPAGSHFLGCYPGKEEHSSDTIDEAKPKRC